MGRLLMRMWNAAVALGWDDVVERFVRYTHEHCYSVDLENHAHGGVSAGSPGATCIMILETFTAHLVKARTWPLDAAGNKLETLTSSKVVSQAMTDKCDMGNKGEGK